MEHAILAMKDAYGMPDKFRENGSSDVRSELLIIPPLASEAATNFMPPSRGAQLPTNWNDSC